MAKQTRKQMSVTSLVVDKNLNVRLVSNYDIPAMKQAILDVGRIIDPIHIRACDNVVLRGNRRTLAGQELSNDPECPQEVAESLKKVDVVIHDVQPGSSEELQVILDQGSQKGLNKTEVLLAVWRLDKQFLSEAQIINHLYFSLAQYTNNPTKAQEAAAITNQRERTEYLRKWLHGTVGNYMLAAAKMGEFVREQTLLTHLSDDKIGLPEGKTITMRVSRDRIRDLSAAKNEDGRNGGWNPTDGGEKFNALIEKFKGQDKGEEGDGDEKKSRPSAKELREKADIFKSPAIRSALLLAAGDKNEGKALYDLDDRLGRFDMITATLTKHAANIKDPAVRALINAILGDSPAGEVEMCIKPFIA